MKQQTISIEVSKGGLLSVPGFAAQGVHVGLKKKRRDVCLIASKGPATGAAVFTQNAFAAAPILVSREHVRGGDVRALVCNSGNANACTGEKGMRDARAMAELTADALGILPEQVLVASTGIIGRPLDLEKVATGIRACADTLDEATGGEAAEAITTTDTHPKEVLVVAHVGERTFHVAGIAKGAGMIHPNMATMLGFLVTDAPIGAVELDGVLRASVAATFNQITVDGDQSTNDMCAILASGAAGGEPLAAGSPELAALTEAVTLASRTLGKMIAADGEGATTLIEVTVQGARTVEDARKAARAVAASNLVKSAVHGHDPNWGRIVAAVGSAGVPLDPARVTVKFEGHGVAALVLVKGEPDTNGALAKASKALAGGEVRIIVDLGLGKARGEAWGCDLTEGYVKFNAAYST